MKPGRPFPRFALVIALVGTAAALGPPPATASPSAPLPQSGDTASVNPVHPEGQEAIDRLRSPFCPGLMLEVCPSPQAAELRDTIHDMARNGAEADSIVSWMLAQYGEEWRAVPRTEGAGLFAWVIPPLALVGGIGVVFLVLRHLRREDDEEGGAVDEGGLSPEEEERLTRAMEEMEAAGR